MIDEKIILRATICNYTQCARWCCPLKFYPGCGWELSLEELVKIFISLGKQNPYFKKYVMESDIRLFNKYYGGVQYGN